MSRVRILLACVLALLVVTTDAEAQFNKWKKKVSASLTKEADKQVDKAIDEAVKCLVGDEECIARACRARESGATMISCRGATSGSPRISPMNGSVVFPPASWSS